MSGLNKFQRMAAETIDGPVLILAGAGSGKTRTITYRIAHMVNNLNIPAEEILAVTFTNKAAHEMRERAMALLGTTRGKENLTISTFHSLGLRILREDIDKLGYSKNYSIFDQSDQVSIIRQALKSYVDADKGKSFDRSVILSKIGVLKNNETGPDDFADSGYFDPESAYDHCIEYCYRFYQDKLKFFNAIDFDDILRLCVRLFGEFPEVANKYSRRFKYVMVDEYQDTNPLQFKMVRGLTSVHRNICVVGDDDQSIYSFRGADISNILDFDKCFPDAKVVKLEENYRSTAPIIKLANEVIKQNKKRCAKSLFSSRPSDLVPLLWSTEDSDHEAQIIVEEVNTLRKKGHRLSEMAILYRGNTQVSPIEDQLRLAGIPYNIVGGQKLYEIKEIRDLIAYLGVINNTSNEVSLRRILNVPSRGIGMVTLQKYLDVAKREHTTLYNAMKRNPALAAKKDSTGNLVNLIEKYRREFRTLPLVAALTGLINEIKYYEWIDRQYDSEKQAKLRKNNLDYFIEAAGRFSRNRPGNATLGDFVEKLLLQDNQDRQREDDSSPHGHDKDEITLMTLHSSKGLEFKTVFIAGMEEETLPHKKTISEDGDIGEERRLCYVGITRAEERLIMTYCKKRKIYGNFIPRNKSRFISELSDLYTEQDRGTFGHLTPEEAEEYKKNFFSNLISGLDA